MAETMPPTVPDDPEVLRAEIERLRAENERLAAAPSPEERQARTRTGWALVIAIVAALLFAISVPALWLNRVVFDTETWVETVAPLAQEPAIQDAVAAAAADAIIEQLDATSRLEALLPDQLDQFAPMLASSVESAIRSQAVNIVRSEQFATVWEEINRKGHQALLTAITGREGALSIQSGVFTLDTGELVDMIKAALEGRGLGLVARIPTEAVDREIVLYQSDAIAAAGPILDGVQSAATVIPLLAIGLAIAAFALAVDRRRVALWLGAGITIGAILPLQLLYFGQYAAVTQVASLTNIPTDAAQSAVDIIFRGLVTADQTLAVFGLLVWFGAVLAGPARWAVALRSGMSGGISGAASHLDMGSFGAWVAGHKQGLRVVGFIGAAVVLLTLPAPRTIVSIIWLAVALLVWLVAVEFFGAATPRPDDAASVAEEIPSDSPEAPGE
jgi:hypothetical protein